MRLHGGGVLNLSHPAPLVQIGSRLPPDVPGSARRSASSSTTMQAMQPIRIARTGALALVVLAGAGTAQAQNGYLRPPDPIPAIVTAQPTPTVLVGRDRQTLALVTREGLPSIAEMAEPELRLAGFRISPRTNGVSSTRAAYSSGITFQDLAGGRPRTVRLPAGARIANTQWSPDGRHL